MKISPRYLISSSAFVAMLGLAPVARAAPSVSVGPGTGWTIFSDPNPTVQTAMNGCSIGAVGRDSANRLVAITAGHCRYDHNAGKNRPAGTPIYRLGNPGAGPIGWFTDNSAFTPAGTGIVNPPSKTDLDYAVIQLNESVVVPLDRSEDNRVTTETVGDAGNFQNACKVGVSTGLTCGLIIGQGGTYYTSFALAGPGDSGGALVVGTKLVGIVAGLDLTRMSFQYYKITPILNAINANGGVGAGFHLL